jgi:hypothetical protein
METKLKQPEPAQQPEPATRQAAGELLDEQLAQVAGGIYPGLLVPAVQKVREA